MDSFKQFASCEVLLHSLPSSQPIDLMKQITTRKTQRKKNLTGKKMIRTEMKSQSVSSNPWKDHTVSQETLQ
ncbi:hypothetical protein ACET3Z_021558 [Daucus carota]